MPPSYRENVGMAKLAGSLSQLPFLHVPIGNHLNDSYSLGFEAIAKPEE